MQDIRVEIIKKRDKLSCLEVEKRSAIINGLLQKKIGELAGDDQNTIFLTYYPLGNEVSLNETTHWLMDNEKPVFFPLSGKAGQMEFYGVNCLEDLHKGRFGVMEPDSDEEKRLIPEEILDTRVLVLTPGVVFDKKGNRMGHGMGYYDRYFERLAGNIYKPEIIKIGIAYDFQLLEEIQAKPWDVKMDYMISD